MKAVRKDYEFDAAFVGFDYVSTVDVRNEFVRLLQSHDFVVDKTGCKMVEIAPANFTVTAPHVFGKVNEDYVRREIEWYEKMSLNVNDIPGGAPKEWLKTADEHGNINSNYGWMAFHGDNYNQYDYVLKELKANPSSRRTCMIYMRPLMWYDYQAFGKSDFCCTWGHTFHIRNGKLNTVVNMRSNDAWAGFRNDRAWAEHVQKKLAGDLGVEVGHMKWHADSLHFYEHQFYLVDHYARTGETSVTRAQYEVLYPDSPWARLAERNEDT